jgi:hypothetical protein
MKAILRLILCTLFPLHLVAGADSPPSVAGYWEAKKPGDEGSVGKLILEPDGTFKMSRPADANGPDDWRGKYTLKGDVLELLFTPRDAAHVHNPMKLKWDKESDTLSVHALVKEDGSETEPSASDKAIRLRRVKAAK